ncbi:uncharacterized protein LOC132195315 [Neocloeon triangulifer]|uniref:uncharacterized protein LOC132195315 n=1 Tax=Neocloeon triangulifer TaxID=2078957 RepID=UPI00286EF228|nr:uncharacterized protein LOC132195315 [Neocloeon triangulifer]
MVPTKVQSTPETDGYELTTIALENNFETEMASEKSEEISTMNLYQSTTEFEISSIPKSILSSISSDVLNSPSSESGFSLITTASKSASSDSTLVPNIAADSTTGILDVSLYSGVLTSNNSPIFSPNTSNPLISEKATSMETLAISSTKTSTDVQTTTTTQTLTTTTITTTSTTTTTTKAPLFCAKDAKMFSNQHLVDADSYGQWKEACGHLFLWGTKAVTWQENHDLCCSFGMMPIMIENDTKRECLTTLANSSEWRFSFNYWTYGRKFRESTSYWWCQKNTTIESNSTLWAPNSSKESDGCINLYINKSVTIYSKNCSKLYSLGCQGQPTAAPPCYKPQCPQLKCEKNQTLFTAVNQDGIYQILLAPFTHGFWYTINTRTYLFSTIEVTWLDAMIACCSIGMKLLSIEYDYEYGNLLEAAINSTNATGNFWTSGSDSGCDGNFAWCSANVLFRGRQTSWGPGEPNNLDGKEHCVVVQLNKTSGILFDRDCSSKLKYICEARDTRNAKINGEAMLDECGMIYNISKDEADLIFNFRTTKLSTKLKCFLKCMGENGGFMWNGKLVDEKVIALIEKFSSSETELQENMAAHQACSSKRGMDDCDTASLIFQCTQEKAPKLFDNILTAAKNDPLVEFAPLQSITHKCVTKYDCIVDPNLRDDYLLERPVAGRQYFTACGTKYLHTVVGGGYLFSQSLCCKFGLKLVSFESVAEVECIVNSSLNAGARNWHTWMAASRLASGKFGWCTSNSPFNLTPTIIDKYPERSGSSTIFLLSIKLGVDMHPNNTYFAQEELGSGLYLMCKP